MVLSCAVVGCTKKGRKEKLSTYHFPSIKCNNGRISERKVRRRKTWVQRLNRADLTETNIRYERVCARHFVSGRPVDDETNVDWAPTLHLGYDFKYNPLGAQRLARRIGREQKKFEKLGICVADKERVVEEHSYTKSGPIIAPKKCCDVNAENIVSATTDDIDSANIDDQVSPDVGLMGKTPTQLSFREYITLLKTFVHPPEKKVKKGKNQPVSVNDNELTRKEPINGTKDNSETESDFEMVRNSRSTDDSQCLLSRMDDVRYSELTKENERLRIELIELKEKYSKCQDLLSSIVKDEKGISVVLLRVNS